MENFILSHTSLLYNIIYLHVKRMFANVKRNNLNDKLNLSVYTDLIYYY